MQRLHCCVILSFLSWYYIAVHISWVDDYVCRPAIHHVIYVRPTLTLITLSYLIYTFYPLEVVGRYRDPQLQVGKNTQTYLIWDETFANMFKHTLHFQWQWFNRLIKEIKTIIFVLSGESVNIMLSVFIVLCLDPFFMPVLCFRHYAHSTNKKGPFSGRKLI